MEIPVYGPPRARDTNSVERHLKTWAVRPSKTSQRKDDSILKQQVSLRHGEAEILDNICTSNKVQEIKNHGEARIPENAYKSPSGLQVVFGNDITYCIKLNHMGEA